MLILLSPIALMSRPAHAQYPYDEILADLQQCRQVMAERLAICNSYPFASAKDRAALDAAYASAAQQGLQQAYGLGSATQRDILDEGARRATGYTFLQLVQGATTITDMIRMLDLLISGVQNLVRQLEGTTPTPTLTPSPTPTPTETLSPTPIPKPTPTLGDVVDDGSGKIKLGWVLYGRTDLSDEAAQAIYDGKVKERIKALDSANAASQSRLATLENKLRKFEEAGKAQDLGKLTQSLRDDLDEAKKERVKALKEFGSFCAKEIAGQMSSGLEKILQLEGVGTGAYDMQTLTMKEQRSREDWEKAGKGLVSIITAASRGYKLVGPVGAFAGLAAGAIYLHLADERVKVLENSIAQATVKVEENRDRFQHQIDIEKATLESLQREKTQLTTKSYLDLR